MRINAVIVTYNRKELLSRCLRAVLAQSVSVGNIFIVDNASTDGTHAFLLQENLISENPPPSTKRMDSTTIHYVQLEQNSGGAGGFYHGMRLAYPHADYLWIMDDDGYPSETCLEQLLQCKEAHDYIMPVSLCAEGDDQLTWFIRKKNNVFTRSYKALRQSFTRGIMTYAVPFNGLLISRGLVEEVGYPKKEMFIWGDDFEYQYRCAAAGTMAITNLDAIFYHPPDRATTYRIFFGMIPLNYSESALRFTCLIRNSTYNYWNYRTRYKILLKFIMYSWLFLVEKKLAMKEYIHYLKCVRDGIKGDFTRHLQFIEKR